MRNLDRINLRYPQLWKRCRLAFSPGVGPSGLILRDFSGGKRSGILSGMTAAAAWVPNGSRYSLNIAGSGSGQRVVYSDLFVSPPYTYSIWARARSLAGGGVTIGGVGYVPFGVPYAMYIDGTTIYVAGTTFFRGFTFSTALNTWYNFTCVVTSAATELYVDGRSIGSQATIGNQTFLNLGAQSDNTFNWNGQLDDFAVWDRVLTTKEIRLRSLRRCIAYEQTQRQSVMKSGVLLRRSLSARIGSRSLN